MQQPDVAIENRTPKGSIGMGRIVIGVVVAVLIGLLILAGRYISLAFEIRNISERFVSNNCFSSGISVPHGDFYCRNPQLMVIEEQTGIPLARLFDRYRRLNLNVNDPTEHEFLARVARVASRIGLREVTVCSPSDRSYWAARIAPAIKQLKAVDHLNLDRFDLTDDVWEKLAGMGIAKLSLYDCEFTKESLAKAELVFLSLRHITIHRCESVATADFTGLKSVKSICLEEYSGEVILPENTGRLSLEIDGTTLRLAHYLSRRSQEFDLTLRGDVKARDAALIVSSPGLRNLRVESNSASPRDMWDKGNVWCRDKPLDSVEFLVYNKGDFNLTDLLVLRQLAQRTSVLDASSGSSAGSHIPSWLWQFARDEGICASGVLGESRLLTESGFVPANKIKVGDDILCRSSRGDSLIRNKVTSVRSVCGKLSSVPMSANAQLTPGAVLALDEILVENIELQFGSPESSLTTTNIQPLYVEGKGWVEAHEVQVGDRLRGKDGPTPEITAIERVPPEPTYVIRTEGNLPYFVSPPGADFSVWVP